MVAVRSNDSVTCRPEAGRLDRVVYKQRRGSEKALPSQVWEPPRHGDVEKDAEFQDQLFQELQAEHQSYTANKKAGTRVTNIQAACANSGDPTRGDV